MDYKVKYEQAIADARAIIKDYKERHLDDIAKRSEEDFSAVFSELKESEDEKIRKGLIDFVNQYGDKFYGQISKEYAIAWLEKQGEQISANSAKTCKDEQKPKFRIGDTIKKESTGDIVTISEIDLQNREYRLSNTGFIPFKYENLWELVEQKPADKVEPKFKVGDAT